MGDVVKRRHRPLVFVADGFRVSETSLKLEQLDSDTKVDFLRVIPKARQTVFRCLDDRYYIKGYVPICADNNDPDTLRNGIAKRLCRVLPTPKKVKLNDLKKFVQKFLVDNFPNKCEFMSFEDWIGGLSFNQNRLKQLREANDRNQGQLPNLRHCHHIETHGKQECYPSYKNARAINSRPDEFKTWFGPLCKSIEKEVYKLHYFVKDVSMDERIERIDALSGKGEFIYSSDFTAFESHFTPEILWCLEFQMFKHFLSTTDFEFLTKVIGGRNKMCMRNKFKAECDGRRMSGEMSTSLSNGFSNLMIAMFLVDQQHGHFNGVVEGDDGLFVTDKELTTEMYSDLGFTIKLKRETDVHLAAFCGLIVSPDKQLIKDPRRVFQRFVWSLKYIMANQRTCNGLLRAKALSLYYELPDCPIIGILARHVISDTNGVTPIFVNDGYHHSIPDIYEVKNFSPTDKTRHLFHHMFGIDVVTQLLIEKMIMAGNFSEIGQYVPIGDSCFSAYDLESIRDMLDFEMRHVHYVV